MKRLMELDEVLSESAILSLSDEELLEYFEEVDKITKQVSYQSFISYNIHDVNLIVKMDAKLKFFSLVYTLMYKAHCNAEDTLGTIQPWTAMCYAKLHSRGEEPELRALFDGDVGYPGAYVQEPIPGRYDWVVSIDAESLYPSMVKMFNMGVETILSEAESYQVRMKICKELSEIEQTPYIMKLRNHIYHGQPIHEFYWEEMYEFKTLKELNITMAPNLAFFRLDRQSLFSEFFTQMGIERKAVKKEMLAAKQKYVDLKESGASDEEIEAADALVSALNNMQQAIKILQNAAYGALANRYFREYYNIKIAEAITLAGQNGVMYTGFKLDNHLSELVGVKRRYSIYKDTDSVYISIPEWVRKYYSQSQIDDVIPVVEGIDNLVKTNIEPNLIRWGEELAAALGCKQNNLIFKREAIATAGIWTAKKRYALMKSNNEGVQYPVPKLEYTGLEAKKSNYPKMCREGLAKCYELALTKSESDVHKYVKEMKIDFMNRHIDEIAAPKGVGEIAKFIDPETGDYIKGTPSHVKGSILYNKLIAKHNLGLKPISESDKILLVPLKPNSVAKYESIAYQEHLPKEFGLDDKIDRQSLFNKTFVDPLNIFLSAIKWSHEPRANATLFFV